MANTRQIEPTTIWSPSGNRVAIYLGLINFFDYRFDNQGGTATYTLLGMQDNPDGIQTAVDLYTANIVIPSEIVQQWGESDEIIFIYVASQLNLTLIIDPLIETAKISFWQNLVQQIKTRLPFLTS